MIDLARQSGLEIMLDPAGGKLTLGAGVEAEHTGARTLAELADVLAVPDALAGREGEVAYWLYRGVHASGDAPALTAHGLRYDLTVILPGEIGREFVKTAGHIHSDASDGVGYPEVYEVVHGRAAFLLQFSDPLRIVIARCNAGQRILIPPGASHLTVNVGAEPLVVADVVAIDSRNDYGEFRERQGAALYLLRDGSRWAKRINPRYSQPPIWTVLDGSQVGPFPPLGGHLYTKAIANLDNLRYLIAPAPWNAAMQALWNQHAPLT